MKAIKLLTLLLLSMHGYSQSLIHVGVDAGIKFDIFGKHDESNYLKTGMPMNGLYGFNLGYEFRNNLILETGVYKNQFSYAFYFKGDNGTKPFKNSSFSNFTSFQVPISLKTKFNLYRNKVSLLSSAGFVWLTNEYRGYQFLSGQGNGWAKDGENIDSASYSLHTVKLSGNNILIQAGSGIEVYVLKTFYLDLSGIFYYGVKKISLLEMTYTVNNSKTYSAGTTFKGNSINILLGLKYPLNKNYKR